MSVSTQIYTDQTSPTVTFTGQTATTLSYSDQTSTSLTYAEQSPVYEGTFFGGEEFGIEFYSSRPLIIGRAE